MSLSLRLFLSGALASIFLAAPSHALGPGRDGWTVTGSATRLDAGAKAYTLVHEMRVVPSTKTPRAVAEADVDKRFVLRLHRDLPCARFVQLLRDGYARNAFTSTAKINDALGACTRPTMKARSQVVVAYKASTRTTTFAVEGMGRVDVAGQDFMRATWTLWLGNVDQPKLAEALVKRL